MTSSFNNEERKSNLYKAIKMRDAVVQRINHKTKQVENLKYSRKHIKDVCNLKAFEAQHIGVYPTKKDKNTWNVN